MSGEGAWWDDASKENIESLRDRFNILESSTYASPRITMTNDSVDMVAERAPPLFGAIIIIAIGIITPLFVNTQFGPLGSLEFIFLGVVMLVFSGAGFLLLRQHFRGDKWLFIHETHLELRYAKSEKGIPKEYKYILPSDVIKIISHERVTESTDEDGSTSISVNQVTSILVYNADEPESRTNQELCLCMTDIPSSSKEESDAIAAALNFLILVIPLPSSIE
ncbi:hypothetical protein N8653_06500 [Euryarchaeota archaeon]|nr:hypothetical protein [Euryarchaeota archaeon]|tara:strand:+ start:255 stop:920 length:666 start_codon:yes stop_codon:yes gene_type:complete